MIIDKSKRNLIWTLTISIIFLLSIFLYFSFFQPNKVENVLTLNPSTSMTETWQLTSRSNSQPEELSQSKDPFKEFLDKKGKGLPSTIENLNPTYPPGFDPFKAKLEEQKSEPHSAVSPFSK
jgi:hypothetical protein